MAEEANAESEAAAEGEAVQKKGDKSAGGKGGGPNPKLIFLVLILNAVAMVGLAGVIWMANAKKSSQVTLADVANGDAGGDGHGKEAHKDDGHGGKSEGKKDGAEGADDHFIKESFTVNLKDSRGSHYAKVDIEIEIDDPFVKDEVNRLRPRIRDFIVVVLSSKSYEQIESVDGRDFLREEIRNKINGYLSRGQIKEVYFTQFIIQ